MEDKGPGSVITPGGTPPPIQPDPPTQEQPEPMPQVAPQVQQLPQVAPTQPEQSPVLPQPLAPAQPQQQTPQQPTQPEPTLAWTAAEYLQHDKTAGWFAIATIGSALIAGIVYLTTKDVVSAGIVFVALLGLIVFASRKPKVQDYTVEGAAIRVGNKIYNIADFKSFSVADDHNAIEVALLPLRRFMPMVTIHVDAHQIDDLVDHLAAYLPMEQRKPDPVDAMLKRLKF